ncbi:MAG: hypothetical protein IJK93_08065 [Muribaculaceae bacterium]|nr:hypothetical protein [Muribaculaceae bacterium]
MKVVFAFSFVLLLLAGATESFAVNNATVDGHEYVDLGLSSGTMWATMNVGASCPEDYGDYFAWGETTPKEIYNWDTYQWNPSNITGIIGETRDLKPEYDAARMNWGPSWHIPTKDQQDELRTECIWQWEQVNGVYGCIVTGPNGNSLFLPAAGLREDSLLNVAGSFGSIWSSSLFESDPCSAFGLDYFNTWLHWSHGYCYFGRVVRPVLNHADATGLTERDAAKPKSGVRYNVMGQPVGNGYKGIVIEDGVKILVR